MKKKELKKLSKLLYYFIDEYKDELQVSSTYIQPEQVNMSDILDIIYRELHNKVNKN